MGEQIARFRSSDRYDDSSFVNKKVGTTFKILSDVNPRLFHDVIQIVRQYLYSGDTVDVHDDEQRALIANAASAKNIDPVAVEKDWWVTAVLYAVFHSSIKDYALFKGGTSLRKPGISSAVSAKMWISLLTEHIILM